MPCVAEQLAYPRSVAAAEEARLLFLLEGPGGAYPEDASTRSFYATDSYPPVSMPTLELPGFEWSRMERDTHWLKVVPTLELPGSGWDDDSGEVEEPPEPLADAGAQGRCRQADQLQGQQGSSLPAVPGTATDDCSEQADAVASSQQPKKRLGAPRRPPGVDQDGMLRLLAEAYGQMMLGHGARRGGDSEEELDEWLRRLRELALSGDGDTVLALFNALRAQHSWARLGDVYSALVRLREMHMRQVEAAGGRRAGP
jgi:hypothetical protein